MLILLLCAASAASPFVVPRDIHAEPAPLLAATRGLVRDARPVLGYDMHGLAMAEAGAASTSFRLGYAGFDRPGQDWAELKTAHQTAADIVFDSDASPAGSTGADRD